MLQKPLNNSGFLFRLLETAVGFFASTIRVSSNFVCGFGCSSLLTQVSPLEVKHFTFEYPMHELLCRNALTYTVHGY